MVPKTKIIKENHYPQELTDEQKDDIIWRTLENWHKLLVHKGVEGVTTEYNDGRIYLNQGVDEKEL